MKTGSGESSVGKPSFLAFATDGKDIETLKAFAAAHQWSDAGIHQGDIKTAAQFLKTNASPVILVVEIPSAAEAPALLEALADVCDPGTRVIAIGTVNEYSFYCWLMDIGIFSYLLEPLTQPMLETAYLKSVEPSSAQARTGKQPGKVIAVMGTRGGVGTTMVALNLAGIIANLSKKQVALADIDPQEGSIALALDIEPSRGLRDVLEKPDRIDSLFIERVMHKPVKNLSVLSAEESLHERINVHDSAAETLLRELRDKFDVVVIDIPRHLNAFSRACLKQAEHVVLVTELTLLSLRDALRLGDLMRESLKMKPPVVVANRLGFALKQEMQAADFEKGINAKLSHRISFTPEVFMQISSDIPAIRHKAHAAVEPLYALAGKLVPEAKQKTAAVGKKPFDFLQKFKKKE